MRRVLDDTDVVGNEREKFVWGLELVELFIDDMKELPSAEPKTKLIAEVKMSKEDIQSAVDEAVEKIKVEMKVPEIIRCKDCKYYYNNDPENIPTANIICFQMHEEDFCSYAERRTDG